MAALPNLEPAFPEILLILAGMAFLLIGVFRGRESTTFTTWASIGAMAVAAWLIHAAHGVPVVTFGGLFAVNAFTAFAKVLTLLGASLALIMINSWSQQSGVARFEIPLLVLFATVGMMLMISANDLIALYVGLELQSLPLYVLAAVNRDNLRSTEAGVKYFVLGALASGLLLYGASMVYGFSGTTTFAGIASATQSGGGHVGVLIGIVFVIAGLSFKVSAVPFHMWTPDVYEGSSTPITAFFSVAPKIAGLALFLRVLVGPFGGMLAEWQQVVIAISLLSMMWGAFAAIVQKNIKRLMAYSSIGHVGYALIGLAVGTVEGARGMLFYMLIYIVMSIGAFACILAMRVDGKAVEDVTDLSGLAKTRPGMAAAMAALMFSMAGIPPLAGIWGKFYIFVAAVNAGLVWLAVVGVLASAVAAYYYLRIVKIMYFDEPGKALDQPAISTAILYGLCSLAMLGLFLVPAPFVNGASIAAKSLFPG
ncbi:MAG: NADH-quinone oxidoreductase subunit NuoN [Rhodospirillaceae bacterium]|nr:MAG: NADH-quinone oxidoreductase subunit NuoN [Rhodospirillaceae bacterium]